MKKDIPHGRNEPGYIDCYSDLGMSDFPFKAFFRKLANDTATDAEYGQEALRRIQDFCNAMDQGETPDENTLFFLFRGFAAVLDGGAWKNAFPLPWEPPKEDWEDTGSAIERRNYDIYHFIRDGKHKNPDVTLDELLHAAAEKFSRSYETVREGYYKAKDEMKRWDFSDLNT